MHKQEASIQNWEFVPTAEGYVVIGYVKGHPKFQDGRRIHTSLVIGFNLRYGIVETLHTFYRLEDYEYEEVVESSKLKRPVSEGCCVVPASVIALCK